MFSVFLDFIFEQHVFLRLGAGSKVKSSLRPSLCGVGGGGQILTELKSRQTLSAVGGAAEDKVCLANGGIGYTVIKELKGEIKPEPQVFIFSYTYPPPFKC